MARYTGPRTKIARKFGEPIFGFDRVLDKKNYPPGQHGISKRRKSPSEYGIQLKEKQKAKYTYGLLERQFRNTFKKAASRKGITGENLLKFLESRLDNTLYRLGIAPSRSSARQLITHKHILVNNDIVNVPSFQLTPGDVVSVRERSKDMGLIRESVAKKAMKFSWLLWDENNLSGTFNQYPEREEIPEKINEQLIVELYSK